MAADAQDRSCVGRARHVQLSVIIAAFALTGAACQQGPDVQPAASSMTQSCSANADVCVSPAGTGVNCSGSQPCSITAAQEKVRQINQTMQKDLVVELLGGQYLISSPLQFAPQDSGFNGHTVRYVAAAGSQPILFGGLSIINWTLHDPAKNIYQASVPAGFDTRQFYVNGVRAQRARLTLQAAAPGVPVLGDGAIWAAQGYQVNIPGMTTWTNVQNIEAVMTDWWVEMRCPVSAVAQDEIALQNPCWTLATTGSSTYPFVLAMEAGLNWLENAYAFLTEPGQWYLDRSANVIYYIPRVGENMETAKIVAGGLQQLVTGSGTLDSTGEPEFVENISFEGLTFAYATWLLPNTSIGFSEIFSGVSRDVTSPYGHRIPGAVTFSRARNISFIGNNFLHLGGSGINFDTGSQAAVIQGNVFTDISGGAITMGDPDDNLQTDVSQQNLGHLVSNNYITNTGAEYQGSSAILIFFTANTSIEHNEIANAPYTGLVLGWGWGWPSYMANNQVNNNYIHDVMQDLYDGAGIYTDGSGSDTVLQGNYLESIGTTGVCSPLSVSYAGYTAIYHDSASAFYSDSQNVIQNMSCSGYWVFLQTGDTNISLSNNYVDVDSVDGCAPGGVPGTSTCLNANGNTVTGLSVFGSVPSAAAQTIIMGAGLTADYQNIKNANLPF
jgi:Right handed beta helix region